MFTFIVKNKIILETTVINNDNPHFGTNGGNNTTDRIFLLSIEELLKYFGDSGQWENPAPVSRWWINDRYNNARIARDTAGSASWWWLRSPANSSSFAALVGSFGYLCLRSGFVSSNSGGVRTALWLNIESVNIP